MRINIGISVLKEKGTVGGELGQRATTSMAQVNATSNAFHVLALSYNTIFIYQLRLGPVKHMNYIYANVLVYTKKKGRMLRKKKRYFHSSEPFCY